MSSFLSEDLLKMSDAKAPTIGFEFLPQLRQAAAAATATAAKTSPNLSSVQSTCGSAADSNEESNDLSYSEITLDRGSSNVSSDSQFFPGYPFFALPPANVPEQKPLPKAEIQPAAEEPEQPQYHFQGFTLRGYNATRTHVYTAQSNTVVVTKGSLEFVADYHVHGLNSSKQFLVCEDYFKNKCTLGSKCGRMHFPPSLPREVHYKDYAPAAGVARLRGGFHVIVSQHGDKEEKQCLIQFRSEDCLTTKGSSHYIDQWAVTGCMPKHKLQVCSYFARDGFCAYGKECNFIHPVAEGVPTTSAVLRQKYADISQRRQRHPRPQPQQQQQQFYPQAQAPFFVQQIPQQQQFTLFPQGGQGQQQQPTCYVIVQQPYANAPPMFVFQQ